ncbi:MAG: hypothetical protein AB1589_42960, partial [Cyanobacteriota bacterium]
MAIIDYLNRSVFKRLSQIAFCADMINDSFTLFYLPILLELSASGSKTETELRELLPQRELRNSIAELDSLGLIQVSRKNGTEYYKPSNKAVQFLETLSSRETEFDSQLRDWLKQKLQLGRDIAQEDVERFLDLVYSWQEQEIQKFAAEISKQDTERRPESAMGDTVMTDNLLQKMQELISHVRLAKIRDQFANILMLHSFMYWIVS